MISALESQSWFYETKPYAVGGLFDGALGSQSICRSSYAAPSIGFETTGIMIGDSRSGKSSLLLSILRAGFVFGVVPEKTRLSTEIGRALGSFCEPEAKYVALDSLLSKSLAIALDYAAEVFAEVEHSHRAVSKRLADSRLSLIRNVGRLVTETGSAAALANRMTPLGAPPYQEA
jgi:hypothetical protein